MKKLMLASFEGKVKMEDRTFNGNRLVVINCDPYEDEQSMVDKATDKIVRWFNIHFTNSELVQAHAFATISEPEPEQKTETENSPNILDAWPAFNSDQIPENKAEGFSEDVLIDIDGTRTKFIVGWYDFHDMEWTSDVPEVKINQKKMKWIKLPHNKESSGSSFS